MLDVDESVLNQTGGAQRPVEDEGFYQEHAQRAEGVFEELEYLRDPGEVDHGIVVDLKGLELLGLRGHRGQYRGFNKDGEAVSGLFFIQVRKLEELGYRGVWVLGDRICEQAEGLSKVLFDNVETELFHFIRFSFL